MQSIGYQPASTGESAKHPVFIDWWEDSSLLQGEGIIAKRIPKKLFWIISDWRRFGQVHDSKKYENTNSWLHFSCSFIWPTEFFSVRLILEILLFLIWKVCDVDSHNYSNLLF